MVGRLRRKVFGADCPSAIHAGGTRTIVRTNPKGFHNALRCKRLTMLNPRLLAWGWRTHPSTVPCKGTTIIRRQLLFLGLWHCYLHFSSVKPNSPLPSRMFQTSSVVRSLGMPGGCLTTGIAHSGMRVFCSSSAFFRNS
jgi:hypothetical protein